MSKQAYKIAAIAAAMIDGLDQPGWPDDGICQHHGVTRIFDQWDVQIADHGGHCLVIVSAHNTARPPWTTREEWFALRRAISSQCESEVLEFWNGETGHISMSTVLDRQPPRALELAIKRYFAMTDVFRPNPAQRAGFAAFREWADRQITDMLAARAEAD